MSPNHSSIHQMNLYFNTINELDKCINYYHNEDNDNHIYVFMTKVEWIVKAFDFLSPALQKQLSDKIYAFIIIGERLFMEIKSSLNSEYQGQYVQAIKIIETFRTSHEAGLRKERGEK